MSAISDRLSRTEREEDPSNAKSGATKVEEGAQEVRNTRAFRWFARFGLFERAVVYLLVGALVLQIVANGRSSSAPDSQGAFAEVARQPAGTELLVVVAVGLAAYAVWRFVEALSRSPQGEKVSGWTRAGWAVIGLLYVGLCVDVIRMIAGSSPSSGPEQHPASLAKSVLQLPLGPELLGLLAAALTAGGIVLIVWGAIHDHTEPLQTTRMKHRTTRKAARASGIVGNVARGIVVLLVASSFFASAASDDPTKAKSLDAALQGLAGAPVGALLLLVVGVGFLSFSAYSVFDACFRRV